MYINYIYNTLTNTSLYNPLVQFLNSNEQFVKDPFSNSASMPLASLNWTDPSININTIYIVIVMKIDNNVPFGIEALEFYKKYWVYDRLSN